LTHDQTNPAFFETGYSNWKDACADFRQHEASDVHQELAMKFAHFTSGKSITSQLSVHTAKEQEKARVALQKMFGVVRFLGRQGLPLRGHDDAEGNLQQTLKLVQQDSDALRAWMSHSRHSKYTSPDIQNEMLSMVTHSVLRQIVRRVQTAKFYSVIADKTTDSSRKQQLSVCIRWASDDLQINEDFVGLYEVPKADADTLSRIILDTLLRLGLDRHLLRGQCYDGASVMPGNSSGVAKRISDIESRAVFVHCMTHSLNLAVQDATRVVKHGVAKQITLLRDILDLTREVINFIKASPKRCRMVQDLQSKEHFHASPEEKPSGLRPVCPTRFTVHYQSLQSLDNNFELLDSALDEISAEMTDETGSKARGFQRQLRTFETLFALEVAMLVFQLTDDCSKITQKVDASALDSQHAMQNVVGMIRNLRSTKSNQT